MIAKKISKSVTLVACGLVLGLAAPAAAHQAAAVAHKVSGHSIKKHSLPANRLKPNSITGAQVDESTLQSPPLVWHPLSLGTNWENGREDRIPAYAVDAQGIVRFKGAIGCAGSCGSAAFTLPSLVSPDDYIDEPTYTSGEHTGEVYITPTGAAFLYDTGGASGPAQQFTSLEGVTYAIS